MSISRRLRFARAWFLVAAIAGPTAALAVGLGFPGQTAFAAKSSKSSKSSKKQSAKRSKKSKSKKRSKKKTTTKKPSSGLPAKPQLRPAQGPVAVVSDLWTGVDVAASVSASQGDARSSEDDLDAIAAQYQMEIATGQVALAAAVAPLPAAVAEPEPEPEPEPVDHSPKWIRHTIIPHEPLDAIAERYGVSKKQILRWNKMDPKKVYLRAGKTLKIRAVAPPPPREQIEYEIKSGDYWEKIAKAHDVEVKLLQKWNKPKKGAKKGKNGQRKLIAGKTLRIWVEPALASGAGDGSPAEVGSKAAPGDNGEARHLIAKVRRNAFSIGKPTKGRVVNGVSLPEGSAMYSLRKPAQAFGSTHTITTAIRAMSDFRQASGYKRELVIGAISLPRGGRFRPHRSHQSGRDIDMRLPVRASVDHHKPPRASEVDWKATWKLIRAFVDTGQVRYIFLEHRLQKVLYKAAQASGASKKELAEVLQWPRPAKSNNGIVRHAAGHTSHIHVRIKCGPKETKCVPVR